MTTRIHVNQMVIAFNRKYGTNFPVYTVKEGSTNRYAQEVIKTGPSRLVDARFEPLSCGAVAYDVTEYPVELINETTWAAIRSAMDEVEAKEEGVNV